MQKFSSNKILESISTSATFSKSETHKLLLQYLVACFENGEICTEQSIANHVYGRDENFNPVEDTIVRVGIFKLRKKLEKYYSSDGKFDPVKLSIPKGHYNIEFNKQHITQPLKAQNISRIVFIVLFVLALSLAVIFIQQVKIRSLEQQMRGYHFLNYQAPVWSDFFNNDYPTLLTIGDFYIFEKYEPSLDYHRRVMDYFINTDLEFDSFKKQHPSESYKKLPIGEIPHHSIYNLQDLSRVFHSFQRHYTITMSSAFDLNTMRDHNIIYIGDFKSLRLLEGLVTSHGISFKNVQGFSGILTVQDVDTDTTLTFDCSQIDLSKESASLDYCIVLKDTGPNGEHYLFITGFGYTAQLETIHLLSDEIRLQQFAEKLRAPNGKASDNFIAVIKVTGFYMTPYKIDVVYSATLRQLK